MALNYTSSTSGFPDEREIARQVATRLGLVTSDPEIITPPDIVDWAESNFYIGRGRTIELQPVQKAVLREFFRIRRGRFVYRTGLYSTIKKSGKTTIAALVMQWAAETWGEMKELFHMGNKLTQAQARAFKIVERSIRWSPKTKRDQWEIAATKMKYKPTGSFIQALPVNAAGEAGGHQALTTWTEFHGYIYEANNRMWEEMQPIPTEQLSFRFVESYAGYKGESLLLETLWNRALKGRRVHSEFPIYATDDGLIAYIDQGVDARRMPWQTPAYYAQAAAESLPHEYDRIHLNEWVNSTDAFVNVALWDRLVADMPPSTDTRDVVLAADASVSGDCTALTAIGWHAVDHVPVEIETSIWTPPDGGVLDYELTLEPAIHAAFERRDWRIIGVAYDPYQLHDMMTRLAKRYAPGDEHIPKVRSEMKTFYPFPQQSRRLQADTGLLTRVRQGTMYHSGNEQVKQHLQNADRKVSGDKAIRIVKRDSTTPIDAIVAISMGIDRMMELMTVVREAEVTDALADLADWEG